MSGAAELQLSSGQLQEIVDAIAAAVRPTIIDLGGHTFSGDLVDDVLLIPESTRKNSISIRKGTLELPPGSQLVVRGWGVRLEDVTIKGTGPAGRRGGLGYEFRHADFTSFLWVDGGGVSLANCSLQFQGGTTVMPQEDDVPQKGPEHLAAMVEKGGSLEMDTCVVSAGGRTLGAGQGTSLSLHKSQLHGGVAVRDGCQAKLSSCNTQAASSKGLCLLVTGAGTRAIATQSSFDDGQGGCIRVCDGATADLTSCTSTRTIQGYGAHVDGAGSRLAMRQCVLGPGHASSCIHVTAGAATDLVGCECHHPLSEHGLCVEGAGSCAVAKQCVFRDTPDDCVVVVAGATAELTDCRAHDTQGIGLKATGAGSCLTATSCRVHDVAVSGIVATEGGQLKLVSCESYNCKVGQGLWVQDAGSSAAARQCKFYKNDGSNVYVADAATAELVNCEVLASVNSTGMQAKGKGSRITAKECKVQDNNIGAIVVCEGADADLAGVDATNLFIQDAGSSATARDCRFHGVKTGACVAIGGGCVVKLRSCKMYDARSSPGLTIQGSGAKVSARDCRFESNHGDGIFVSDGSAAELVGCKVQGNGSSTSIEVSLQAKVTAKGCSLDKPVHAHLAGEYVSLDTASSSPSSPHGASALRVSAPSLRTLAPGMVTLSSSGQRSPNASSPKAGSSSRSLLRPSLTVDLSSPGSSSQDASPSPGTSGGLSPMGTPRGHALVLQDITIVRTASGGMAPRKIVSVSSLRRKQ
eukprot:CAMPEP_0202917626 /NCGR_PEP_ID=MMETSP1392-20130828/71435_1 /ASSEMBLY_ACC=CAM_ASM_000868 /TAXON_ID=225041 /ORGANISM="Chlamydomonas chlamydogama, Strain SAG 11-48b" /LENGTH=750 /DNA_ID=CAMNT_0049610431 /DNA_START=176 /DNA_END=2428 /DNA_ORIENTATION=+